jgi:hypothetical protein
MRRVAPGEERRSGCLLAVDEIERVPDHLVVDCLHPLLGEWPRVLDALFADPSEASVLGRVVLVARP